MDYNIKAISSWLTDGSCHRADILTFVGIGGIGKTSLAKYVFQLHSAEFHKSNFLENIDKRCKEQYNGLLDLQKQLRKVISKTIPLQVNDVSKKVFIVLDDIGNVDQLDDLLGNKGLHPGSKIIITSKDASITEKCALFNPQVQPEHKKVSLNGLHWSASLKLLCIHAFKSHEPKEGYENVSKELVKYCVGHPLALKVLGSFLNNQDVAYWEDYIKVLKKEPHHDIKRALQMSIDFLPSENDKKLFKHIACFFVGKDRDLTETILHACGMYAKSGIVNLIDRCLLSIEWGNELVMHSLIQEVGKDLVRQESPDKPWKRSRVWYHEESFKVLKENKDKGNLQGLALDMRMLDAKKLSGSFELKTDSLSRMDKVMLLQLNYVQLNEHFQNFPEELRWLCMHGFPLKAIHLDLPMENLVALDMSYSNIEYFDMSYGDPQPLAKRQKQLVGSCSRDKRLFKSLKILNLSFCKHLHSVGGFSELPALEKLVVKNCLSLMKVCESIEQCVELVHIDLCYCSKLRKLPISLGNLKKVKTLLLDGCNFQTSSSAIMEAIPSDLMFLALSLPRSLVYLSLANNNLSNESFPMDWSCLAMLEKLCLDFNPIVSMPSCVRTLPRLKILNMEECCRLISIEHPPRTLRRLSVTTENFTLLVSKIKFDPEMSPLALDGDWCSITSGPLVEIDGVLKIQDMADVEEKVLHSLGWTDLDFIKERRLKVSWSVQQEYLPTQICYEFGIFSTFYVGDSMPNCISWRREGSSVSFTIPLSPYKLRGLNFCCVENIPPADNYFDLPTIKISNITEKNTWIYQPLIVNVRSKGEYLIYLSHWMFGPDEIKCGDNITINVVAKKCYDQQIMECGIGLVYDEDGKIEEEDALGYYKSWNHRIGGDLSAFQLKTGEYFLERMAFAEYRADEFYDPFTDEEAIYKEDHMNSFVAFSQKKSETLGSQKQCSQTRPTSMAPAVGQQMFYDEAQPTFIPPQLGLGHQKQLIPGIRSGGNSMPNFYMPMVPPGQHEPRPGGSHVGVPGQRNQQQSVPLMQQQMVPYGLMSHHLLDAPMGDVLYDVENVMHLLDAGGISALTNDSPTGQRTISGENLERLEAESEAKVTTDFLCLMESPEAIEENFAEAMEVEQADELGSLLSL